VLAAHNLTSLRDRQSGQLPSWPKAVTPGNYASRFAGSRKTGSRKFVRKARGGPATALTLAAAALVAGCASGTPASGLASARPVAATATVQAGTASTVPPAFAVSFAPAKAGRLGDRLALLSSRTGDLLRWLAPQPERATDEVLTAQGQAIWVNGPARPGGPWTIWRWSGGVPVKITALPALGPSPAYGER